MLWWVYSITTFYWQLNNHMFFQSQMRLSLKMSLHLYFSCCFHCNSCSSMEVEGVIYWLNQTSSLTMITLERHITLFSNIQVEACTSVGCSASGMSQDFRTLPAPPEGVPAPHLYSDTPTSVLLSWGAPEWSNGPLERWEMIKYIHLNPSVKLLFVYKFHCILCQVADWAQSCWDQTSLHSGPSPTRASPSFLPWLFIGPQSLDYLPVSTCAP